MHRMECPHIVAIARGCAFTRSQESVREICCPRSTRGFELVANAVPLLRSLPATPATAAAAPAQRLRTAAATRGSARSSAAAASLPLLCATSSGVAPYCSRGEGRGAGRRAPEPPLRAPHPECQRVHPRGREEEGDDGVTAFVSRPMQRGRAILQGRRRRGREEGGGKVRGGAQGGGRRAQGATGGALWIAGAPARPPTIGPNPRRLSPIA